MTCTNRGMVQIFFSPSNLNFSTVFLSAVGFGLNFDGCMLHLMFF
ncbi:hypothetical protein Pint_11232 [Pistacia integerrima]|uniref:Uncharacterized protein n=1 Tax=Pistacia integerrima TaxID=434235 RepID=A0ACC0XHF5_9ROSI|nr:hypothetical protein Pint_11232 [Pistacia integerrima]